MKKTIKIMLSIVVLLLLAATIMLSIYMRLTPAVLMGIAAVITSFALFLDKLRKIF